MGFRKHWLGNTALLSKDTQQTADKSFITTTKHVDNNFCVRPCHVCSNFLIGTFLVLVTVLLSVFQPFVVRGSTY